MLGKSKPKQLVEKIDQFKMEQAEKYQFDQYEDEFWIVTDIDDNLNEDKIEKFHAALDDCDRKGYGYAISNPFFELWLLLHHDDVTDEDRAFAVTDVHITTAIKYRRFYLYKFLSATLSSIAVALATAQSSALQNKNLFCVKFIDI